MREGMTLVAYMTQVFASVNWIPWIILMVGYSLFYFVIDTLVVGLHRSNPSYSTFMSSSVATFTPELPTLP